jgi:hypothetical protein
MAQADYIVANGTGAAVRSDLNGQLAAIVSNNSGATEPATMYAYQWWADTTAGLLKIRNAANNAWITLRELDGTLLMEDGTAAAPGLSFASDLDTGFFSAGANAIGIATNGVERVEFGTGEVVFNDGGANYDFRIEGDTNANLFFVDASAEAVGIGTAGSGNKLDVNGSISASGAFINTGFAPHVHIGLSGGNPSIASGNNVAATFLPLVFRQETSTGASEAMRIDPSSRLLVGTSTARSNFFNTTLTAGIQVEGTGASTARGALSVVNNDSSNNPALLILGRSRTASLSSNTVVADADWIGTLSFQGADGTEFVEAASVAAFVDGTPGANDMPGRLVFSTTADGASSPTERMRIHSAGNMSFNGTDVTTTNGSVGNVYKFFGGAANPIVAFETSGTNANACLEYRRTGRSGNARTSQISIGENASNQGQVDVYSSTANADLTGGVRLVNGATSWSSISDIRLKDIGSHFNNALDDVSTLEAFRFTWKDDSNATPQVGLSAQSVQAVLPEAVASGKPINAPEGDDTEYLSVRYTEVIPLLVAALQESKERIEALEAEVAALKAQ